MRLSGKNFQSWADFDLGIEGLTILTGPSDTGKSAIFRALKGILRNEIPAEYVRDGQEAALEIAAEIGGHAISARRTRRGSTTYVIDGQDYAKLAKAIPDAVRDLKFNEIVIGDFDIDPIFGRQNSAQFLIDPLTYKPTEVNAILGAFGGTERLEQGKKEANLRKTQKDAEARTIAGQMREAEERSFALRPMLETAKSLSDRLRELEGGARNLETEAHWLDAASDYRQRLAPLRQILDTLVLPDVTGLDELHRLVACAEQAAEAGAYARWLAKPLAALSGVAADWDRARALWGEIAALENAAEAGKHVVSTDRLKTSLAGVETTFSEAVSLWRGIRDLESLAALLGELKDSAGRLAGVETELSAAQAELRKGLCPRCGRPLEHVCA